MIFRLFAIYNKHEMLKILNQTRKNRMYYFKFSNNFADDCSYHTSLKQLPKALGGTLITSFSFIYIIEKVLLCKKNSSVKF